jgi:hypothetical protein
MVWKALAKRPLSMWYKCEVSIVALSKGRLNERMVYGQRPIV